jgi:Stage II sporulation protein E (SpoIIE)
MVNYQRTPPLPPTARWLAAAVALGCCCALALTLIPTVVAQPNHLRQTLGVAADRAPAGGRGSGNGEQGSGGREGSAGRGQGPGAEQQGSGGEQGSGNREQPGPGGQQGSGNREQPGSGGEQATGSGAQSSSGREQPGAGSRGHQGVGRHETQAAAPRHEQQGSAREPSGSARQDAASRPEPHASGREQSSSASGVRRAAARREPQTNAGGRERHGSGREQTGAGSRGQQAPGSTPAAAAAAPAVASVPSAGAPAPTPSAAVTVGTPPQTVGASPTVTRRLSQAPTRRARGRRTVRRARHARARATGGNLAPGALSAGAAAPATALAAASARARRARGAAQRSRGHGRSSPLVTTITTIVDVVPVPLRILLGVLLALAVALGLRSRVVALRARRLERQRAQLLEDVGLLQAALLPVPPARLGPVGTSAAYRPADGPGAGGDFYDVFALGDGRLAVIVGDVSGHGRQALPHTALVRFTLRAYLEAGLSPRSAVQTAGAVLERQLGDSFATVAAATYHPRERLLVYACAGHPPPLVLGAHSLAPVTLCAAPPIGVGMRTGTRQTVVSLPGRGRVCFHTDGVTDARVGPELYGELRLERALAGLGSGGSGATASALLDRVAAETDVRPDDMAACLLCVEGGAGAPTVLTEELELDRAAAGSERTERFLLACGVAPEELSELVGSARTAAGRTGTVVLELRFAGGGSPVAVLQHDNVTPLDAPRAPRRASLGVSR